MENKKYFTFINATRCIGSNDNEYVGVTTCVTLSRFNDKIVNDGPLVTARAAISNKAHILSSALDKEITPDEQGNVWVDVNFWGDRADKFKKFLNGREKVRVVLVGVLTYREFTREDSTVGQQVSINVTNWMSVDYKKEN